MKSASWCRCGFCIRQHRRTVGAWLFGLGAAVAFGAFLAYVVLGVMAS